jgi:hypothetical protein
LRLWAEHKEVPMPFIDWLTERGMEQQAKAAQWAYDAPERHVWNTAYTKSKPFPVVDKDISRVCWFIPIVCMDAEDLPLWPEHRSEGVNFDTIEEALCYLLDNVKGEAK